MERGMGEDRNECKGGGLGKGCMGNKGGSRKYEGMSTMKGNNGLRGI